MAGTLPAVANDKAPQRELRGLFDGQPVVIRPACRGRA